MYVCMYVNTFIVCAILIQCRAGPVVVFRSSCFNGPVAEVRIYAALTGQAAAIRSHCRTSPVTVVRSHLARHLMV